MDLILSVYGLFNITINRSQSIEIGDNESFDLC